MKFPAAIGLFLLAAKLPIVEALEKGHYTFEKWCPEFCNDLKSLDFRLHGNDVYGMFRFFTRSSLFYL